MLRLRRTTRKPSPLRIRTTTSITLSPILFVIDAAALSPSGPAKAWRQTTSYVDNEIMVQGATTQKEATRTIQTQLNERIERARFLNIWYAPAKSELVHLYTGTTGERSKAKITLYNTQIEPGDSIKCLGVQIDTRLTFRAHAAAAASRTRRAAGQLWQITKQKGASPRALHHLITTATLANLLWGLGDLVDGGKAHPQPTLATLQQPRHNHHRSP